MQTGYPEVHFLEGFCGGWFCWSNNDNPESLGLVVPDKSGLIIFQPTHYVEISRVQLRDIVLFIGQLEERKLT